MNSHLKRIICFIHSKNSLNRQQDYLDSEVNVLLASDIILALINKIFPINRIE